MKLFFHDCHQYIDRYCNPYLSNDGILGSSEEHLDPEMLFDPAEEKLHLPATFVESSNGQGRQAEIVCKKNKEFFRLDVEVANAPQSLGVIFSRIEPLQHNCLIETKPASFVHGSRIKPTEAGILLGACNEKCRALLNPKQPSKVEITAIENIKGSGFESKQVQNIHVVNIARRDVDPARYIATQVQQGVCLDGGFACAETRPGKKGEAKADGGRIEGIRCLNQLHAKTLETIKLLSLSDQDLGEFRPNMKVPFFVGMGQCTSGNACAQTHVPEFGLVSPETTLDISQTLAVCQLGEGHTEVLIHATESLDVSFSVVHFHATSELLVRDKFHHLSEDCTSVVHGSPPILEEYTMCWNSNRSRTKTVI